MALTPERRLIIPSQPGRPAPWLQALEMQAYSRSLINRILESNDPEVASIGGWEVDKCLLDMAVPFSWNEETTAATLAASRSVPGDTVLNQWNLNTEAVWWYFDRPLPYRTVSAFEDTGIRAMNVGWFMTVPDKWTFPAGTESRLIERVLLGAQVPVIRQLGIRLWVDDHQKQFKIAPSQTMMWNEGETLDAMITRIRSEHRDVYGPGGRWEHKEQVGEQVFMTATEAVSRFLLAGLAWLNQKVAVTDDGHVERHRRKQIKRECGLDVHAVQIVSLRRTERKPANETIALEGAKTKEWKCRWTVDGHWRNQVCGPKRGDRRLTWIGAYVKGPDDKPFREPRQKVYVVNR